MPPAGSRVGASGDALVADPTNSRALTQTSDALEELDRPSLNNLTSNSYGIPETKPNPLLESLGKNLNHITVWLKCAISKPPHMGSPCLIYTFFLLSGRYTTHW